MLRRLTALIAGLLFALAAAGLATPTAAANGCITPAAGTADHPYLIENASNLNCLMGNDTYYWSHDYYFKQTADIDMSGELAWTHGIGTITTAFKGHYDGGFHTINGLTISSGSETRLGLFGFIDNDSTIQDLGVTGITVTAASSSQPVLGGLVGELGGRATITRSFVTGSITASNTTTGAWVGGLVGFSGNGVISDSYSLAAVNNQSVTLTPIHAGDTSFTGALVALAFNYDKPMSLSDSYGSGAVTANFAGGGVEYVGGFAGGMDADSPNVLHGTRLRWETTSTGQSLCTGLDSDTSVTCSGLTSRQMTDINNFSGWSISGGASGGTTWGICSGVNSGRPFLNGFGYICPPAPSPSTPAPTTFTLLLNANGGVCWASEISGVSGTWITLPIASMCTRADHELTGWSTGQQGDGLGFIPGGQTVLTGDNTLYANWRPTSTSSTSTPPEATSPPTTINVSITRDEKNSRVVITGTTTAITPGTVLNSWFRKRGITEYHRGADVTVGADGNFTWSRPSKRRIYAYFTLPGTSTRSPRASA